MLGAESDFGAGRIWRLRPARQAGARLDAIDQRSCRCWRRWAWSSAGAPAQAADLGATHARHGRAGPEHPGRHSLFRLAPHRQRHLDKVDPAALRQNVAVCCRPGSTSPRGHRNDFWLGTEAFARRGRRVASPPGTGARGSRRDGEDHLTRFSPGSILRFRFGRLLPMKAGFGARWRTGRRAALRQLQRKSMRRVNQFQPHHHLAGRRRRRFQPRRVVGPLPPWSAPRRPSPCRRIMTASTST